MYFAEEYAPRSEEFSIEDFYRFIESYLERPLTREEKISISQWVSSNFTVSRRAPGGSNGVSRVYYRFC